ncbi:MAG: Na+/H+ antiporter subunit B [Planctomycetota bacterium]
MNHIILRTAARLLLPLLLVFSVFLLIRGHNLPGGGFVGGLLASAAYALHSLAYGIEASRRALLFRPRALVGVGLLTALGSGLPALFVGRPLMTGLWLTLDGKDGLHLGTPLLFDIGVYLVVIGSTLMYVFGLQEPDASGDAQ